MPSRGYRKGVADDKTPLTRKLYARVSEPESDAVNRDADARSITVSKVIRGLIKAHYSHQRLALPHPRAINAEALRQLDRLGNNLNQLAKQANSGMVPVSATDLLHTLAETNALIKRL
jgi:Bacterial mobilisation protein (MobC)